MKDDWNLIYDLLEKIYIYPNLVTHINCSTQSINKPLVTDCPVYMPRFQLITSSNILYVNV